MIYGWPNGLTGRKDILMKQLTNYKRATGYLDKIFKLLNAKYFNNELPAVIITIQSTPTAYGHFTCYDAWHCGADREGFQEINIGAGTLDRPIENVTATLLHEMVHEYCFVNGIKDTSRNGTYHNKRFRDEAVKRDLDIEYDPRIGFSITAPTENLLNFCIDNGLEDIQMGRNDLYGMYHGGIAGGKSTTGGTTKRPGSNSRKYVCPCCGNIARTTKDMLLICGTCSEEMILS